jgi:hypothetical protein
MVLGLVQVMVWVTVPARGNPTYPAAAINNR